jgi:drug/metabolite transporter (DMT)-like permease
LRRPVNTPADMSDQTKSAGESRAGLALALMAFSACLFAIMNFLARMATASAPWPTVAAVRAAIGALVAYSYARARGGTVRTNDYRAVFWRSFFGTISMLSTFYALSSKALSLGDVVTLLNLAPVFLALFSPFFLRERTSPLMAVAIAVALSGVVFVVRPSFVFGHHGAVAAVTTGPSAAMTAAVAIAAATSTSIAMMMLRRVGQTETPEAIAFHFSILATGVLIVLSLFDLHVPSTRDAICMVLAGVCAGIAQLSMTRAYTLENAARVGGMSYLAVPASALLGAAFLGERPGPTATIGMLMVVAGGVLVMQRRRS